MQSRWMGALVGLHVVTLLLLAAVAFGVGQSVANARAAEEWEHSSIGFDLSQRGEDVGASLADALSILKTEVAEYRGPGIMGSGGHPGLSERLDEMRTVLWDIGSRLSEIEDDIDTLCRSSGTFCP